MIDYKKPKIMENIQSQIENDDIFLIDDPDYGLETHPHVTIVYGLENHVRYTDLKKYLVDINKYRGAILNVSLFENEEYDVLKMDIKCSEAEKSNELIKDDFIIHTNYPKYHAHMTIGYLKKGRGKRYINKEIHKMEIVEPTNFSYSWYEKDEINEVMKQISF